MFRALHVRTAFAVGALVVFAVGCSGGIASIPTGTSSGDALARKGFAAYEKGQYQQASTLLQEAAETGLKEFKLAEIYTSIGNCHNELDEFDESIAWHEKALAIDPNSHQAWVNLGVVHRLTSNLDKAESCYQKALAIKPDYPELHASLGALYIFRNEPEKAVEAIEKSIKLDAQLPTAHANVSLAYAMVGRFDEAHKSLKQAVILGYENGDVIRKRIDALKAVAN